jgi:hypothetical protein
MIPAMKNEVVVVVVVVVVGMTSSEEVSVSVVLALMGSSLFQSGSSFFAIGLSSASARRVASRLLWLIPWPFRTSTPAVLWSESGTCATLSRRRRRR